MNTIPKALSEDHQLSPHMGLAMMIANLPSSGTRKTFVDQWGYTWCQESTTGYRRAHDDFFLPNMKMYNHYNHSVEARIEIWNQIKNSGGKTVVSTISFSDLFP